MDAVTKAAEALKNLKGFTLIGEAEIRYVAADVLDAVGYDALRAERDRLSKALYVIVNGPPSNPHHIARAALEES